MVGQWTRQLSEKADVRVQAYYDHSDRDDPLLYRPREDVFDFAFQNGLRFEGQHVLWGAEYRLAPDDLPCSNRSTSRSSAAALGSASG